MMVITPSPHQPIDEMSDDEIYCPECGNTERCYSCASQGGWISKIELDALERDEDRSRLILAVVEAMELAGYKQ